MEQLRVRRITTTESNNVFYALFENGKLLEPICLMESWQAHELFKELKEAIKED